MGPCSDATCMVFKVKFWQILWKILNPKQIQMLKIQMLKHLTFLNFGSVRSAAAAATADRADAI